MFICVILLKAVGGEKDRVASGQVARAVARVNKHATEITVLDVVVFPNSPFTLLHVFCANGVSFIIVPRYGVSALC